MNLRTLLVLGRISNLPTVWSNLLAGWILARGGLEPGRLALLLLGGSFLYVGGMYLNDFCDAAFDVQHVPTRPIPAERISRRAVGLFATMWFTAGLGSYLMLGEMTFGLAMLLALAIVVYDFWHKEVVVAPLVMGGCRFLLYPMAAAAHGALAPDYIFFAGAALGLYVAGITFLARGESRPGKPVRFALLLLLVPIVLAARSSLREGLPFFTASLVFFSALQLGWIAWLLVPLWTGRNRSIGRVVSGLLAGIVLVDAVLVVPAGYGLGLLLLPLFPAALVLQRFVAAT
jgi:4-hydroxybenzoate polyprenyltransferase